MPTRGSGAVAGGAVAGGAVAGGLAGAAALPAGGNRAVADFLGGDGAGGAGAGNRAAVADRMQNRPADAGNLRNQAADRLQTAQGDRQTAQGDRQGNRQGDRQQRQDARIQDRGDYRSNLQENRQNRRNDWQDQLGDRADQIRDEIRNEFDDNHLFEDFWYDHPNAYFRFQQNPVFWSWATWGAVSSFFPWNWGTAAYYDYGSGGNVYYEGDTVYANGEQVPAEEYAQQAEQLATSAPPPDQAQDQQWMPLGVFALSKDGDTKAAPTLFLQLAVSKDGIIAGTLQNKATDETQSIEGMVDKKTQRAAWTISGKNTPIMETGIANLTENEAKALVHFADGTTQQWMMLHIENPNASQGGGDSGGGNASGSGNANGGSSGGGQ